MREPLDEDPERLPVTRPRPPVVTWRPRTGKVRACTVCGVPRWSMSPADRLHVRCRREGERAGLVHPGGGS